MRAPEVGRPLYTGTLEKGQFQRFTKKALFLSVEPARNVVVKVDGAAYRPRPERNAEGRRGEDRLG